MSAQSGVEPESFADRLAVAIRKDNPEVSDAEVASQSGPS